MEQEVIPICPKCGEQLQKRKGKYGIFWGCPNYRQCGFKGMPLRGEIKEKPEVLRSEQPNPMLLILEEIQAFRKETNDKLEAIQQEWAKKLEGIREAFKQLK